MHHLHSHFRRQPDDEESVGRFILDVIVNSAVIISMYLIVQYFIAAPFQVVGQSMANTLYDGEYIVVSKLEYTFGQPERGDIVVFHPPHQKKDYYIKRIIGVPGDTVRLKNGRVFVNGKEMTEPYIREQVITCIVAFMQDCPNDDKVYTVPEGKYFVLGDNRNGSSDSRSWYDQDNTPDPFVDLAQIQGKTRVVIYPLPEIRLIREGG